MSSAAANVDSATTTVTTPVTNNSRVTLIMPPAGKAILIVIGAPIHGISFMEHCSAQLGGIAKVEVKNRRRLWTLFFHSEMLAGTVGGSKMAFPEAGVSFGERRV